MKKAKRAEIERRIRERAQFWNDALQLPRVRLVFNTGKYSGRGDERFDDQGNWTTKATCSADWRYEDYLLEFYVEAFEDNDDQELDRTVCHELVHAALHEMREWAIAGDLGAKGRKLSLDHEEHVVTRMTRVLQALAAKAAA